MAGAWVGRAWVSLEGAFRVRARDRWVVDRMAAEPGGADGEYVLRVTVEELEAMGVLDRLPECGKEGCGRPVRAGERGAVGKYCSPEHRYDDARERAWLESDQGRRFLELREGGADGS